MKLHRRLFMLIPLLVCLSLISQGIAAEDEFPGRKLFVKATPIETEELKASYAQVTIVDVRSRYEYDTLHIKGAKHLGLYESDFGKKAKALQDANGKLIVFYCNGRTCYKSYKAADKARSAGVRSKVYDAGVFDWAKAYPQHAMLLGTELMDADRLLSKSDFSQHQLQPGEFADRIAADESPMVLDIRSRKQRRGTGLFMFKEESIPLDDAARIEKFIQQVKASGKPLFVYDMAGKQVRWFQYYLEANRVTEYYFMKGGYRGYFKS